MSDIWHKTSVLKAKRYQCGHCGSGISSERGYSAEFNKALYICHTCERPTFFDLQRDIQIPNAMPGKFFEHLPEDIMALFMEAKASYSVGAYTASVMCCRKLLMNVAVAHEADEGLKFEDYRNFINSKDLVAKPCKFIIEEIRDIGGLANHKIELASQEDADKVLTFIDVLLENCYEIPGKYKSPTAEKQPDLEVGERRVPNILRVG